MIGGVLVVTGTGVAVGAASVASSAGAAASASAATAGSVASFASVASTSVAASSPGCEFPCDSFCASRPRCASRLVPRFAHRDLGWRCRLWWLLSLSFSRRSPDLHSTVTTTLCSRSSHRCRTCCPGLPSTGLSYSTRRRGPRLKRSSFSHSGTRGRLARSSASIRFQLQPGCASAAAYVCPGSRWW